MKTQNVMMLLVAAVLAWMPVAADETYDKLLKELEAMKANQQQLQKRLAEQNQQLREMREQMDSGVAQVKDTGPIVKLRKNAKDLQIKGDLRIRAEQIETDNDHDIGNTGLATNGQTYENRQLRHRFRLAMLWNTSDGWQIGAGLATGGASAVSTNQTWNNTTEWETGDIRLDYAYAIHSWGKTTVCVGQQKNPYLHAGLTFDGDVRPTGVTVKQSVGPMFVSGGLYSVRHVGTNEAEAGLGAVQAGMKIGEDGKPSATLAGSFYYFNSGAAENALATGSNDFRIGSLYWDVIIPVGGLELGAFGEYTHNFGASGNTYFDGANYWSDSQLFGNYDDDNNGANPDYNGASTLDPSENADSAVIGVKAKYGRLSANYAYVVCQSDALYNPVKDADYVIGAADSDLKGHVLRAGVKLTDNLSLNGTMYFFERDNGEYEANIGEGVANDKVSHYRLDLLYTF